MTTTPVQRRARFDWSLETLVLLLVGAEAVVVALLTTAAFVGFVLPAGGFWLGWIFLVLLLGTNLQRAMDAYRFFSPQYEILSVVVLLTLLLGSVRVLVFGERTLADLSWLRRGADALAHPSDTLALPILYTLLLVAYAWWRGRTRDEPSVDAAYRALRAGTPVTIVAIVLTMIVGDTAGDATLRNGMYGGAITFLSLTLAAIALGRLRVEQARGALTLSPRWLFTFLAPVAALVLIGTLVAGIFTRRFLETVLWILTPVFRLIDLLLLILVYIATAFAWLLFTILSFLIDRLGGTASAPPPARASIATPTSDPLSGVRPVEYPEVVRYLLVAALLFALTFFLTRFLWRRRPRLLLAAGEERESIFSWGLLAAGAAGVLADLSARFRRPLDPLVALRADPRWRHTVVVRELYTRLLRRGVDVARPRASDQTPDEYASVISDSAPPSAVQALTERYDGARYSEQPATAADAAAARAAWEAIEHSDQSDKHG